MENFIDFFLNFLWWLLLFLSHFCEMWFWKWYVILLSTWINLNSFISLCLFLYALAFLFRAYFISVSFLMLSCFYSIRACYFLFTCDLILSVCFCFSSPKVCLLWYFFKRFIGLEITLFYIAHALKIYVYLTFMKFWEKVSTFVSNLLI